MTNIAGAVTNTYTYAAFGQTDDANALGGAGDTRYLFTGQQFDDQTGLYHLRARQYDPANGRFLARDTWAYNFQHPVELNRYVYAMGNPVRFIDPTGLFISGDYAKTNENSINSSQALQQGFRLKPPTNPMNPADSGLLTIKRHIGYSFWWLILVLLLPGDQVHDPDQGLGRKPDSGPNPDPSPGTPYQPAPGTDPQPTPGPSPTPSPSPDRGYNLAYCSFVNVSNG